MAGFSIPTIAGAVILALFIRTAAAAPDDDAALWAEIQNATDPAPYENYLARFPNGANAPMARARVDALMTRQAGPGGGESGEAGGAPACPLEGDAVAGEREAKECRLCHAFEIGRPSRSTGPNLSRVFGARIASVDDFTLYSAAMLEVSRQGLVWDGDTLDSYLKSPGEFLAKRTGTPEPLHNMFYRLTDVTRRGQVIAYIQSLARCR
ncbi:MAG: hypothetical protein HQL33_08745 [Alphaproteobacteria bacterium]|nr:hypothetical protein [Alphaproteobacteria bacterium]